MPTITRTVDIPGNLAEDAQAVLRARVRLRVDMRRRWYWFDWRATVTGPQEAVEAALRELAAVLHADWWDRQC